MFRFDGAILKEVRGISSFASFSYDVKYLLKVDYLNGVIAKVKQRHLLKMLSLKKKLTKT